MSIRRSVLEKIGLQKFWLGPGSSGGPGGDESELIYRILRSGYILAFNPKIIIFHNRWVNNKDWEIIDAGYTRGLMTFYAYYLWLGEKSSIKFIKNRITETIIVDFRRFIIRIGRLKLKEIYWNRNEMESVFRQLVNMVYGFIVGTFYFFKEAK